MFARYVGMYIGMNLSNFFLCNRNNKHAGTPSGMTLGV